MRLLLSATASTLLLLMPFSSLFAATYYVSPSGNNAWSGGQAAPWLTLQHAADMVSAGDTVLIGSGTYAGFRAKSGGAEGTPIVFAADDGASVAVNAVSPDSWKGSIIEIENYDWWVIDSLEVRDAPQNAGVDIRVADHVTVRNCVCLNNEKWGIFTGFAEYFTAEYNECAYSVQEHGIYHSNSGDNAVIRYNVCHHNAACGIQINADPSMGGDGISSYATISRNILFENGAEGGAAINLASVRDSLIANNLIYLNQAGGIAAWDDGQGAEWGSKNNKFYNNTVHMPSNGRWALNLVHGSSGNEIFNNVLIHDGSYRGGIEIDNSSLAGLASDYNVLCRASVDEFAMDLSSWQSGHSMDLHSECLSADRIFVSPGADYHLSEGTFAEDGGIFLAEIKDDLEGTPRPFGAGFDIGAYERISCENEPAMIEGGEKYAAIQVAYDWAADGDAILCRGEVLQGGLESSAIPAKTVELSGGHDCDFSEDPTGVTTMTGALTIETGTLVFKVGTFAVVGG